MRQVSYGPLVLEALAEHLAEAADILARHGYVRQSRTAEEFRRMIDRDLERLADD